MTKVVYANPDLHRPVVEFAQVARFVALSRGSPSEAALLAREANATDRVVQVLEKAAVGAGSLADPNWAGDLAGYQSLAAAFLQSLQHASVFDRVLPHMVRCPLNATVGVTTLGASGDDAMEGSFKKISELSVAASGQVPVTKAVCVLVFTADLLRSVSADALALIRKELRAGVVKTTDSTFMQLVTAGASSMAAAGDDLDSIRDGLRWLLQTVQTGAESRLFFVTSSPIAKALSIMGNDGGFAFPNMTPSGGTVGGTEVLVSDAVGDDEVVLLSADQIAASAGTIRLDSASHATLRMSSTPDSDPTLSSLWQANKIGLRAERYYGAVPLRSDCAAVLTGLDLEGTI